MTDKEVELKKANCVSTRNPYLVEIGDAILERLLESLVRDLLDEGREIRFRHVKESIWLKVSSAECQDVDGGQLGLELWKRKRWLPFNALS